MFSKSIIGNYIAITTFIFLIILNNTVLAETFTTELPELIGEVYSYPNGSSSLFDFGTSFLEIDEVRIQINGTFIPGQARSIETGQLLEFTPQIELYMEPGIGCCSTILSPLESPFNIGKTFELNFNATWDFLLDGTDEVNADLIWAIWHGYVLVTEPELEISEAHLIIDGTVPEPLSIILMFTGVLVIRAKRCKNIRI